MLISWGTEERGGEGAGCWGLRLVVRRARLKPGLQNGEATDRLEHWLLNASRSLDSILKDAAAADRKALSSQASSPLKHLELRNLG
jgi:hypothetical protein